MFCPRLDSALVASIYHDMKDFKACIPILSALAADTSGGGAGSNTNVTPTTTLKTSAQQTNGRKPASATTTKNKKANPAPTTDKNILIWSEEVANSNTSTAPAVTSSPARSGLFKSNKQGQVTNSSSFQQPTTLVNSPAIPITQAQPVKASYKAARNPRYMQKHAVVDLPFETLDDAAEDYNQEVPEDDSVSDDEQDAALGDAQETLAEDETASTGGTGPKKKKNRRQKRHEKAGNGGSLPPSLRVTPQRGTWRKDANAGLLGTGAGDDDRNNSSQKSGDSNEAEDDEDEDEEEDSAVVPENATRRIVNGIKTEELEFLKSCFPDREYSDDYLAQVLKDCRRDLEAAVEMILSQMFLENEQVETSSSGSGSFNSSLTNSSTTTSSLDDAFFEGAQNGKASRKKWKTTGSVGLGSTASDGVAAWGAARHQPGWDGPNDPLLKTVDRQEDILIPESNEWATFDHQISILMNIFHTVPKGTIVSEYHANGAHLFKTVECIEARLKQESRNGSSAAQGRERQTQFDINLAQLMEMFPEHSAVGLKKMLVYNSGNVQDAMNAVLAADFARADMNDRPTTTTSGSASKRANVIPFQADIRYANKNEAPKPTSSGNRLKSLPSTSNPFPGGPRPFPNTIVDNANAHLYNDDDDPVWCRQRAHEILDQRNELFRKAAKAYQATKGKGAGMSGIAAYYADEGKKLDVQGKQWHMRAARAVVQQHR